MDTVALAEIKRKADFDHTRDIFVLPETFLPAISTYAPGYAKFIYNQNGAYTFGLSENDGFPGPRQVLEIYRHPEVKHILCVSENDKELLAEGMRLGSENVSHIVNGIETDLFKPHKTKRRTISLMPRKNRKDAEIVVELLRMQPWFRAGGWDVKIISGVPQTEVARILQESMIFLAFGHPEGFGLPIAEAIACGCAVVGYSGLGGLEVMRIIEQCRAGNEVSFGDWKGFTKGCHAIHKRVEQDQDELMISLNFASSLVRRKYSPRATLSSLQENINKWESKIR